MTVTIWIDSWQMECCGESFGPGEVVAWQLVVVGAEDHADVVGGRRAVEIDFREEHHGGAGEEAVAAVKVVGVEEVHCRYEIPPGSESDVRQPVPGTTEFFPVGRAEKWVEERPGLEFCGYLVTAEPVVG
ncbi:MULTISPECIES: DUF6578 domain-containing protein [Streptomyces]|uniref:DUF6578 domain-containing protein n=1 Tax=Streptomyces TaxID=1883 RepID=UPI000EF86E47|nr:MULTISPECIES: DUF6578 domain-containing protein [Streptomyces]RZD67219.1 hypothetical protein C0Q57_15130 [Streptomyces albidoflavus]